ncbi:DUF1538 family protein [Aliikangiella maris]|uniref:DUF1538 domain-containing protein n=2 Tax=Aliikangiella maris TaxID=3162458 RepID=A0ABV3MR97_9GAMM
MREIIATFKESLRDLMPIVMVILFFQTVVMQQPIPNIVEILFGSICVLLGLACFIQGLQLALFPIGESMAYDLTQKGSLFWLIVFAFSLGFGTAIAEPALMTVAKEAAHAASVIGHIQNNTTELESYANNLRITVAISVGVAIIIGIVKILRGWSIQWLIIGGYLLVILLTLFAPLEIIAIAYDSGGVTTSTITVPLVTALGVGLANSIKGRNPMTDGFGLIAFAVLTPIIAVMLFGIFH